MPREFWLLAIAGLVLISLLLFVHEITPLHQGMMALYSGYTGLALFLIYDLSHPFSGAMQIAGCVPGQSAIHPLGHLKLARLQPRRALEPATATRYRLDLPDVALRAVCWPRLPSARSYTMRAWTFTSSTSKGFIAAGRVVSQRKVARLVAQPSARMQRKSEAR